MKYIAYLRKSSEQAEQQILSLADQKKEILEKFPDLEIIEFIEESNTAFEPNKRPKFNDMLEKLNSGFADAIVGWHPNRLSRNEIEAAIITYGVRKGVVKDLKFVSFNFENSPEGIKYLQMTMSDAQYSSAKSSVDIVRALKNKAERGEFSGLAPLGYRNTPELLKGQRIILPDKKRFDLCRKWWDYMLSGLYTVEQSLDQITKDGLRNRKGKIVSRSKAYDFFRDIFYTGSFKYAGITHSNGIHKHMVSMTEWVKVQQILDSKGKKGAGTLDLPNEKTFIGMLKCGECGATISMERHIKNYKNGNTQTFWYYRCTKKIGPCSQPCLNAKDFNPQIEAYIKGLELNPLFGEWIKKVLKRRNKQEFTLEKKSQELNTKRLADITDRKEKLYNMKLDNLFSEIEYQKRKGELLMEEQLLRENFIKPQTEYWEKVIDNSISFASSVTNLFQYGDIYTRQMVLRILGSNLTLKDKKVEIEAKKAFVFLKDVQNDVWHKNLILEPKIMTKLPHEVVNYRTSIHSCAGDWT